MIFRVDVGLTQQIAPMFFYDGKREYMKDKRNGSVIFD